MADAPPESPVEAAHADGHGDAHADNDGATHAYDHSATHADDHRPPPRRENWYGSRTFAFALLTVATLFVLDPARSFLSPLSPLGDDASSHITTIGTFARILASGDGWWSTDYNLGFPLVLYYQPLPHLASALVCLAFGGPTRATLTYKLLATFMVAVQPWAVYGGARRMGFERSAAAFAGVCAPLVLNGIDFGYHAYASLKIGLYTQAWGNVALPLAVGELVALCSGRGRVWTTTVTCALVAACHMFYAIALVPPILLFALLRRRPLPALGRLAAVGAATFAVLSAWLVPLAANQAFFGGWPFGRESRVNGYGWEITARIVSGEVMDAESTVPVLSALAVAGLATAALRLRRCDASRLVWILVVWAFVGTVGRAGFGGLIDLYPMHRSVQLFRYAALFQFSLLLAAGLGLATIADFLGRQVSGVAGLVVAAVVLLNPAIEGAEQLKTGFRTIDDTHYFTPTTYFEAMGWIADEPVDGRLYLGPKSETRGHYHSGLVPHLTLRPGAQSYGVGLHDSLHFYTLEYFNPVNTGARDLAELFDFRLVLAAVGHDMPGLGEIDRIHRNTRYGLYRIPGEHHSVAIFREAGRITGTPRGVRRQIREWLNGNGPRVGKTIVLDVDEPRSRADLVGAPRGVTGRREFDGNPHPAGSVVHSEARGARFSATVDLDEPALVAAKVGYHPFWQVTVDGVETPTLFVFPGLPAVEVPPGEHEIVGEFRWPTWTRWLAFLGPLPLIAAFVLERRRRRPRNQPEADETTGPLYHPPS